MPFLEAKLLRYFWLLTIVPSSVELLKSPSPSFEWLVPFRRVSHLGFRILLRFMYSRFWMRSVKYVEEQGLYLYGATEEVKPNQGANPLCFSHFIFPCGPVQLIERVWKPERCILRDTGKWWGGYSWKAQRRSGNLMGSGKTPAGRKRNGIGP